MTREEILSIAKPILFNTDMVRAILDGRKSVTRRICKDGNDFTVPDMSFYDAYKRTYAVHNYADKEHADKLSIAERTCPICPGDYLYVRETWSEWADGYVYKAWTSPFPQPGRYADEFMTWHPSIHMPKEAARIFLRVTDVRVERLHDISNKEAKLEGVSVATDNSGMMHRFAFSKLWDSTIPRKDLDKYGWDVNPWVWVIRFERVEV